MKFSIATVLFASYIQVSSGFVQPSTAPATSFSASSAKTSFASVPSVSAKRIQLILAASNAVDSEKAATSPKRDLEAIHRDADMIFAVIDVDGSGSISQEEMTNHLKVAGYTEQVIQTIFTKMDTDKNGEISQQEFRGGMAMFVALQSAPGLGNFNADFVQEIYEDADQVFQSVDADKSGYIDEFELKSHLGRKFASYSDSAIDRIFQLLDVNGDKKISKQELRDAFVQYSALRQAIGEGPNFK